MKPDGGGRREAEAEKWAQAMRAVAQGENARRMAAAAKKRADEEARYEETVRANTAKVLARMAAAIECSKAEDAIKEGLGESFWGDWSVKVVKSGGRLTAALRIPYVNFYRDWDQTYHATGADAEALRAALKQALADSPPVRNSPQWEQCRADKFAGSPPAYFFGRSAQRVAHCADCRHPLDSKVHAECGACRGMICPSCACCGCRISSWQYY